MNISPSLPSLSAAHPSDDHPHEFMNSINMIVMTICIFSITNISSIVPIIINIGWNSSIKNGMKQ
jgi:hypothetical protein